MKNFFRNVALISSVLAVSIIVCYAVLAWTEPGDTPTDGTINAPVNTGGTDQSKTGALSIGNGLKYWITKLSDSFVLKNNSGTITMVVGQDGKMGIGTTNPSQKLDVAGNVNGTGFCLNGVCCTTWAECMTLGGGTTCTPNASKGCSGGNVYWYDSCGNIGSLFATCTGGCSAGACGPTPVSCTAALASGAKRVFVTNGTFSGSQLSSVGAANQLCATAAANASLAGSFSALVYLGSSLPNYLGKISNIKNSSGTCEEILIANGGGLFNGTSLLGPIQFDERGNSVIRTVWTNFKTSGSGGYQPLTNSATNLCTGLNMAPIRFNNACLYSFASWYGWGDERSSEYWFGNNTQSSSAWAYSGTWGQYCAAASVAPMTNCDAQRNALYCVEQ